MLHTLTIHDTTGRINHDAFMDSFKWISLRYFEFTSTITLKVEKPQIDHFKKSEPNTYVHAIYCYCFNIADNVGLV